MRAKAAPEIETAVRKMLKQKIKRVSASDQRGQLAGATDLVDIKQLDTGE